MSVNYGSRRLVVGAHYGLRDWLMQRVTGTLMAVFTLALLVQVLFSSGPLGYDSWSGIFAAQWMKALTFVTLVSLGWHAWVGVRDVVMDYVRSAAARLVLHVLVLVWLVGCMGWAVQVLWRL
jgi:succinate dehydrogenase / fumarate reductase, membrane anchor subunit